MDIWKTVVPSLNEKIQHLLDSHPENEKIYKSYIYAVNSYFSFGAESLPFSNLMNRYNNLDGKMHYDFYFHALPKRKRFNSWKKKEVINNLEFVKEYYDYSEQKAKEVIKILTDQQLEKIKEKVFKG